MSKFSAAPSAYVAGLIALDASPLSSREKRGVCKEGRGMRIRIYAPCASTQAGLHHWLLFFFFFFFHALYSLNFFLRRWLRLRFGTLDPDLRIFSGGLFSAQMCVILKDFFSCSLKPLLSVNTIHERSA